AGWDAATPAAFTFVLKAPQRITHIARLRDVDDPLRYFLETARQLGSKLGPILFQLPPNFKKDVDRLNDLLTQFPADLRCAWEFRHAPWFADDVYEALRVGNAALCVADTEEGHTPLVATADFGYMRLRDEGYTPQDLEHWAQSVKTLREIAVPGRLDHPPILTLIDSGAAEGFLFYVVPYVRGESLREKLTREKQLPLEQALQITQQVAGALDYAHRQGVIHRDIKPEN